MHRALAFVRAGRIRTGPSMSLANRPLRKAGRLLIWKGGYDVYWSLCSKSGAEESGEEGVARVSVLGRSIGRHFIFALRPFGD